MSTTPKAKEDCFMCHAPAGHRHTPNCVVVVGLPGPMDHKKMLGMSSTKVIFDEVEHFGNWK